MTVDRASDPARRASLDADLASAVAAAGIGTWHWDAASGSVRWDAAMEALAGLEPGSFGSTFDAWLATLHPEEAESIVARVEHAIEHLAAYQFEHRAIWPDGSIRWLECRGQVTVGGDGAFTGTVGCAIDITERKAVEVAREQALARERRIRDRIEFLSSVSAAAIAADDHHMFMSAACLAAVPRLGDWCTVHFIPEPGAPVEVVLAHTDPDKLAWAEALTLRFPYDPRGTTGVARVVRSGETEFLERVTDEVIEAAIEGSEHDPSELREIIATLQLTSIITVPLRTKRGVLGAMQFVSAESGRVYDTDDVALAETVAGRIAEALDNMWLNDQHLHISATLQRALLPPAVPEIPGIDLAVRYWPAGHASEVGGDFYDVFETERGHWSLLIGDVCGTGPDAAALTGIARHTVRAAARHGQDHEAVLEWLNQAMRFSNRGRFCTAAYATLVLDEASGAFTLTTASGGHPLPLVIHADGTGEVIGEPGTLLGVFDDVRFVPHLVELAPGDMVVLYTDGISDLAPPHGLRPDEVLELVRGCIDEESIDAIADAVHAAVTEHLPVEQRPDDIALVVFRVVA